MSEAGSAQAPSRSIFRSPFFWAAIAGLILIPAMRPFLRFEPPPPPVLGQLPAFTLTDTRGEPFGTEQLEGNVWVANFIFTRCASICPLLSRAMQRLDQRYREENVEGIHLVSITVDPEYDTPERLREYGESFGVDPDRWSMLTGSPERIQSLVVEGFKTPMGEPEMQNGTLMDIAHSGKFVLLDAANNIRGYYDADETGIDEIFHRSQHIKQ